MLRVALAGVFAARLEMLIRARLQVPCDLVSADETAIVPRLGEVDVLVTLAFTRAMGAAARRLKLVQVPGAGLDRIDRSALPAGILGYGRIGQGVARRALAFDMDVCAVRRDPAGPVAGVRVGGPAMLDEVLRRADHLVLTLPLTSATRGLIGDAQLRAMKPTAVLINVARAEIVDEDALYRALKAQTIAGAVLDVWYRYPTDAAPTPPARRAFEELPNVLMTPHVSGWTEGMLQARAAVIAENIHRTARAEPPVNLVGASD